MIKIETFEEIDQRLASLQTKLKRTQALQELDNIRGLVAALRWQHQQGHCSKTTPDDWKQVTADIQNAWSKVEAARPRSEASNGKVPKDMTRYGFTGNMCMDCGSDQMVRSGTCEKCSVCGSTTGCS